MNPVPTRAARSFATSGIADGCYEVTSGGSRVSGAADTALRSASTDAPCRGRSAERPRRSSRIDSIAGTGARLYALPVRALDGKTALVTGAAGAWGEP
jgi:hypothetical protein